MVNLKNHLTKINQNEKQTKLNLLFTEKVRYELLP